MAASSGAARPAGEPSAAAGAAAPAADARADRARPLDPYWTTWLATLLFFAAFYALLVPLPRYLAAVGLPDWQIGLVLGAFGVASLVGRPIAGLAADRFGPRRVMLVGAASLAIGALGTPATGELPALFALRLLQAAGYVAFTTAGTALVVALVDRSERGRRLALFGAAANVAVTVTPALVGLLLDRAPVTAGLHLAGALALVCGALALRLPPAPTVGEAAAVAAVPSAPSGAILADAEPAASGELEGRSPSKSEPGEAVQADAHGAVRPTRRALATAMLASALLGSAFAAFFLFAPILAERRGALPPGQLYALYGAAIIATRLLAGRLVDRLDAGRVVAIAALLTALGHALIAATTTPLPLLAAPVLIAAGGGLFHPALIAHHAALLPGAPGRASAAFYVAFDLGIGLGSWLFGLALELAGLPGLYWSAAILAAAVLPLTPTLTRGAAHARR